MDNGHVAQRTPTRDDLESASRSHRSLSARQREVLDLLTVGKTNPEISEHLGMTLDGAKWHVSQVLWKLGFTSRDEAAAFRRWQLARRNRVWPPPSLRDPRWSVVGALLVLCLAAFALTRTGADHIVPLDGSSKLVEVAPTGDSVSRHSVIEITFSEAQDADNPADLVSIEPAIEGTFSWTSDRTLVFRPTSPGLVQGQRYRVRIKTKSGTAEETTVTETFITAPLATVETVTPANGDTGAPGDTKISIQFSGPVVSPSFVGEEQAEPVIVFDPPIEGSGEWLDTSLYRFTPDELAPNSEYTATIVDGLEFALDGNSEGEFTWTFRTYKPAIESMFPTFNMPYASPRQEVTIRFNQPMSRASAEAGFAMRLSTGGSSATVQGTFVWLEDDSVVVFRPTGELKLGTSYQVDVSRGLVAATGEPKTERPGTVVFTTIGPAMVAATQPSDGAVAVEAQEVEIRFLNPMDVTSMDGLITVSGFNASDIQLAWNDDDTIVRFTIELAPATEYTVSIAKSGTNIFGLPLAPKEFSFTTSEAPDRN